MTRDGLRRLLVLPRPTAWRVFVLLLVTALGSEYWDKDPFAFGGLAIPWPRFMLAFTLLPLLIPPRGRRWSGLLTLPAPLGPMWLFWLICALSVIGLALAPGGSSAAQFTRTFVHLSVYMVFVTVLVKWITFPRLALLVRSYYALGIVAALLAVLQSVHGTFGVFSWMAPLRFDSAEYTVGEGLTAGFRASSFFGEPSWAARYWIHFLALALAFWWQTRRRRHLAAIALLLVAFYAANSLLGYVILASFVGAGLAAQAWRSSVFSFGRPQKAALAVLAYAAVLLWLLDLTPQLPDLLERSVARVQMVVEGRGGGVSNRIDGVWAGLDVWRLAPVFGVGLGNIDVYIVRFYQDPEWILRSQHASDSVYVQLLAETGVVGLLAFGWFWLRLLWFSAPAGYMDRAGPDAARAFGWMRFLQLDLLAQAVGMINASDYLNPHLWTVIAIVLACKVLVLRDGTLPAAAQAARPAGPAPAWAV